MAVIHPPWFRPAFFSRAVLNFSFRKIGWLPAEDALNLDLLEEEVREAVQTVGRAVFTLQVIMRNRLRPLFIESINLIAGAVNGNSSEAILQFMSQGYLENDVFNVFLSNFAIIAELIIFLDDFGIPISPILYHMPWCNIYMGRLKNELAAKGGFEKMLKVARRRYVETGLYSETLFSVVSHTPSPHAEELQATDWPENPLEFLHNRFGVVPQNMELAFNILRELYALRRPGLVPTFEEAHIWI